MQSIGISKVRDGLLYVPTRARGRSGYPLLVAFHGAGGSGWQMAEALAEACGESGTLLFAPDSKGRTWDLILGEGLEDREFLGKSLREIHREFPIDPSKRGACGFSDGASYALTLGLEEERGFTHVMAFSPGFMAPRRIANHPYVYLSHGADDHVHHISETSWLILPKLRKIGLNVTYREFQEGHTLPEEIVKEAFEWFLGPRMARHVDLEEIHTRETGLEST